MVDISLYTRTMDSTSIKRWCVFLCRDFAHLMTGLPSHCPFCCFLLCSFLCLSPNASPKQRQISNLRFHRQSLVGCILYQKAVDIANNPPTTIWSASFKFLGDWSVGGRELCYCQSAVQFLVSGLSTLFKATPLQI